MAATAEPRAAVVGRLFREHGAHVMRVVRRMGVRDGDVEDVTQEVFVVAQRRLGQLRAPEAARAWLYGIVRKLAADYRKRAHRRREVLASELPERAAGDVGGGSGGGGDPRAELRLLERALEGLSGDQRAVFVLYELEGLPMREVAQALGCPRFTAHTRLRAARKRVRAALQGELEQEREEGRHARS